MPRQHTGGAFVAGHRPIADERWRGRNADLLMQTDDSQPLFAHVADDVHWTITGTNLLSGDESKEEFAGEVLAPFGARFSEPFGPVKVRGVREDADTVIVLWDGEGTKLDRKPCENTHAWFMSFRDGLVAEATAFCDSGIFNELWDEVGSHGA